MISGDVDQGREMTVPLTEIEGLDAARTCGHGVVDGVRSDLGERPVAVPLPHAVQRSESGVACVIEPVVDVVAVGRCGMGPGLLEVPAQFVDHGRLAGHQQPVPLAGAVHAPLGTDARIARA